MKCKKIFILFIVFIFNLTAIYGSSIKSPDEFFGKTIGGDRILIKYPDIIRYFKYLAKNSKKIKLTLEGYSTLSNPMYAAFISSEENIKNLNNLIEVNRLLSDPSKISSSKAKLLISKGKPFILITCATHATEIGSTQMALILAYELLTSNSNKIKNILKNTVIILMPSINPDGNIMVTEWYNKWLGTKYEGCSMPYLYHHYAGHDTNRDFFMLNLKESKVVNAVLHKKYFPQIFLDMHQMGRTGPRMFVPPFKDPFNQNLSPLMLRTTSILGEYMAFKLEQAGKKGVATSYAFDAYWPGGSKNTAWYKNVIGLLTELASVKIATPIFIDYNELSGGRKGLPEYKAQVNFPSPWKGGWWRLKDIIEYELIAVKALLEIVSLTPKTYLENFYTLGLENLKKGEKEKPYYYIIPATHQHDISETYTFLMKMEENGVKIYRTKNSFNISNKHIKKGDFVIPLSQPYRAFIKAMMEKQTYPEIKYSKDGPIIEPYDQTGWTMPLMMGVNYFELNEKIEPNKLEPLKNIHYPEPVIEENGDYYLLSTNSNRSFILINKLLEKKTTVFRALSRKGKINRGDFIVPKKEIPKQTIKRLAKESGVINIKGVYINNDVKLLRVEKSKIAIYQPYVPSMDEGWTRWVLDNYGFKYKILHNEDFKNKKEIKADTLIIASISRNTIIDGASRWYRDLPPKYKGGIGKKGIKKLINFVKNGGNLILLGRSYELAEKDFKLPIRNVLNAKGKEFYCPGAILKIEVMNSDPLGWGFREESIIYMAGSIAFRTSIPYSKDIERFVVGRFSDKNNHLLSGYIKGDKLLNRRAIIVRLRYFKGNVFVFGGAIQRRAQTYATFKFLFNALMWNI